MFSSKEHRGAGQSYSDFITHVRGLYHKTVLVPLRKCLDITEVNRNNNNNNIMYICFAIISGSGMCDASQLPHTEVNAQTMCKNMRTALILTDQFYALTDSQGTA